MLQSSKTERADSDRFASGKSDRIYSWYKPSLSLRDISPKGRDKFDLRTQKAFLPEEGGAAQAVTEGAAREQVCIRGSLMRYI